MTTAILDRSLITKYDRPGPRYTSYPTAVQFKQQPDDSILRQALRADAVQRPLSLYVHLPFCHQLCWYCGCHMKVSRDEAQMAQHLEHILLEIDQMAPLLAGRSVLQLHLGGGSPNQLPPKLLARLVRHLFSRFHFEPNAEISVELDPRRLDGSYVAVLAELGFNRVSLGIQDFDADVQVAINRVQPFNMVAEVLARLRDHGINAVNMDLIYGLPRQNISGFRKTLARVLELAPNRIALFNYAHLPHLKPHMKLIKSGQLPRPDQKTSLFETAIAQLTDAGYLFIGMDHFAQPDDALAAAFKTGGLHRNFQGYTTQPDLDMIGFGASAISMLDRLYVQNEPAFKRYEALIAQGRSAVYRGVALDADDLLRRGIIQNLMCRFEIDANTIPRRLGISFDDYFPGVRRQLEQMRGDGLLDRDNQIYRVTEQGRLLLRNIAMPFDKYLSQVDAKRFSRTV